MSTVVYGHFTISSDSVDIYHLILQKQTDTTLANVTGLSFQLPPMEMWVGRFALNCTWAAVLGNIKIAITTPSGATLLVFASGYINSHTRLWNNDY